MENDSSVNQRLCSVEWCSEPFLCRSFCERHYAQWKRRGRILPDACHLKVCKTLECGKPYSAKDLCKNCYATELRNRQRSDPDIRAKKVKAVQAYRQRHLEKVSAYEREYRRRPENVAKRRQNDQKPEHVERRRRYQQSDQGKVIARAIRFKRNILLRGTESDVSGAWLRCLWQFTYFCECCAVTLNETVLRHLDHIQPMCEGGRNLRTNVRLICFRCNVRRPRHGRDSAWNWLQTSCCLRISAIIINGRTEFEGHLIGA